jgi:hypothetical protein
VDNHYFHWVKPSDFVIFVNHARNLWHSVTRSSRSTCRSRWNRKGKSVESGGASQEEQKLSPGSGVRSAVRKTNDVKYLPSHGGLSDTGQRVVCLREPRGAGEFRLTGHSGFSAFPGQKSDCGSAGSISSGPSLRTEPTALATP